MSNGVRSLLASLLSVSLVSVAMAANDANDYGLGERSIFSERAIEERIKAEGDVCLEGENCVGNGGAAGSAQAAGVPAQAAAEPRTADAIYNRFCMACHTTGAAGAPKLGNADDWAPRIEQGMETMVKHAINGLNAMPPKGTCGDCSDAEIEATVEYMVEKSQ